MRDAASLYGEALQKFMTEGIVKTRLDKQTNSFRTEGKAMNFTEAEEKYKDQPETWKNILENATQFTCPISGLQKIVAEPEQLGLTVNIILHP